jgi:hypothetical protein
VVKRASHRLKPLAMKSAIEKIRIMNGDNTMTSMMEGEGLVNPVILNLMSGRSVHQDKD